jgi:hypothetical protein
MVHRGWLIVMKMLEATSIPGSIEEWHVSVSVIDSIAFFAVKVLENVVLHDWILSLSSIHCSGSISRNGVTKSKYVFILIVLKCVSIHIDESL